MLSLAVIGMGNRARKYLAYLQDHPDAFRVGAVVEPSEVHLEAARRRRSLRLLCAALPSTLPTAESIAGRGDHRDVALGPTGPHRWTDVHASGRTKHPAIPPAERYRPFSFFLRLRCPCRRTISAVFVLPQVRGGQCGTSGSRLRAGGQRPGTGLRPYPSHVAALVGPSRSRSHGRLRRPLAPCLSGSYALRVAPQEHPDNNPWPQLLFPQVQ